MVILGLGDVAQYPQIVRHHEAGTIPPTVIWEKLPYRLHGDPANWDREKHSRGQQMLELWKRHAPNPWQRGD